MTAAYHIDTLGSIKIDGDDAPVTGLIRSEKVNYNFITMFNLANLTTYYSELAKTSLLFLDYKAFFSSTKSSLFPLLLGYTASYSDPCTV